MAEFDEKQERIQALLTERDLEALLLRRVSSFGWATCGVASYVNTAATTGEAVLLVTPSGRHLLTNNIEEPRLAAEERLAEQGWQFHVSPWYESMDTVSQLTRGLRLGADGPFPGAIDLARPLARLRASLTPEEGERFRALGSLCARAIEAAARAVRPGQTEYEIAALLAEESERRGVQAIVNLVGADEHVFAFPHPLPGRKEVQRYAMLVLCGRHEGLVCSVTRLVHFGALPEDLSRKATAVAQVDATFLDGTRPGRTLAQVFAEATVAYAACGFPEEWRRHHQGGPAGYE
ncbi:MAG: M24 family metallopeptidase, partial [Candidatus Brocadiia bacterium]